MKYKIEIAPLVDYYVVAVKDKNTSELKDVFTLNESGADMLRLFCQDNDMETVAKEMSTIYDIPIDIAIRDVRKFTDYLGKKSLL